MMGSKDPVSGDPICKGATMTEQPKTWTVGQIVEVHPRTWAGINRPGGHGRIVNIQLDQYGAIQTLDVKYTVTGGFDRSLDPALVAEYRELNRLGRRGRAKRMTAEEGAAAPPTNPSRNKENSRNRRAPSLKSKEEEKANQKKPSKRKSKETKKSLKKRVQAVRVTENTSTLKRKIAQRTPIKVPRTIQLDAKSMEVSPLQFMEGVESQALSKSMYMLSAKDRGCHGPTVTRPSDLDYASGAESSVGEGVARRGPFSSARSLGSGMLSPSSSCAGVTFRSSRDRELDVNALVPPPQRQHQVSLFDIYHREHQEAVAFVDEIVDNSCKQKAAPVKYDDKSLEEEEVEENTRFAEFMSWFTELLQENGGSADEDQIMPALASIGKGDNDFQVSQDYTKTEVEGYISTLCEQNKVMRSGGVLFSI